MSKTDPADVAAMTALVLQENQAKERLERATDGLQTWRERIELARRAGDASLAQLAEEQKAQAETEAAEATFELERLANEKSALRLEANLPDETNSLANAEALLENFRTMGVRPEDAEIQKLEREQTGEDMLAALKSKMKNE